MGADVIPVFDELCKCVLSFVSSCYHSDSAVVRFVLKHGIDVRVNSPLRRHVTFRSLRYGVSVLDLCSLPLRGSFFRESLRRSLGAEFARLS